MFPRTSRNAVLLHANIANIANTRKHCKHGCKHLFRKHVFTNVPNHQFLYVVFASVGTCSDMHREVVLSSNLGRECANGGGLRCWLQCQPTWHEQHEAVWKTSEPDFKSSIIDLSLPLSIYILLYEYRESEIINLTSPCTLGRIYVGMLSV